MKIVKLLSGAALLFVLFFSTTTQFVACTKTETIYDTLIIKDTVTIIDSSACNCYDLKDGLVAYYNFKGGTLKDSSGKNNHIVFNNATLTTDRFGKANSAYLFNGTSNYMRVANSTSLNPTSAITIMAIVKPNGYYSGDCKGNEIVTKTYGDFVNGYYSMRYATTTGCSTPLDVNNVYFMTGYGNYTSGSIPSGALTDTIPVKTNKWYHVVYTYEAGVSKQYIDGVLKTETIKSTTFTPNAFDLYIGATPAPQFPYWLNGVIDEVRIYEKALCAEAVKQLYNEKE